jgi:hypothetical protein
MVWISDLILDEQLPIDVGREYLGIPKEPAPKRMEFVHDGAHVAFADAEPDGTPIMSGTIVVDGTTAPAADLAMHPMPLVNTARFAIGRGGNVYLRATFADIRHQGAVGFLQGLAHSADPAGIAVGRFGPDSQVEVNPATMLGGLITTLGFAPVVSVLVPGARIALDATL